MQRELAASRLGTTFSETGALASEAERRFRVMRTNQPSRPCRHNCIHNLVVINGAKQQWALEHRQVDGSIVQDGDIFRGQLVTLLRNLFARTGVSIP